MIIDAYSASLSFTVSQSLTLSLATLLAYALAWKATK